VLLLCRGGGVVGAVTTSGWQARPWRSGTSNGGREDIGRNGTRRPEGEGEEAATGDFYS
jgi:hypothetical protein